MGRRKSTKPVLKNEKNASIIGYNNLVKPQYRISRAMGESANFYKSLYLHVDRSGERWFKIPAAKTASGNEETFVINGLALHAGKVVYEREQEAIRKAKREAAEAKAKAERESADAAELAASRERPFTTHTITVDEFLERIKIDAMAEDRAKHPVEWFLVDALYARLRDMPDVKQSLILGYLLETCCIIEKEAGL